MTTPSPEHMIASNKHAWDASADLHRRGPGWQRLLANFKNPDFSCLDATLTQRLLEVGVKGREVIQLGCNNGRETLSLLAMGARRAVGVDQSVAFLRQAAELAECSAHAPEFIEADIHHLPANLQGAFDVALITIGVLNWMPDLETFMACVASTLKPGGQLVIYETHPFLEMFDPTGPNPFTPSDSYFREAPVVLEEAIVYEGDAPAGAAPSYWHIHTLGDLFTALIGAGLQIRHFQEYAHSNREDAYAPYENRTAQVPMCFTCVSVR